MLGMKINEPVGQADYGPMFLRLTLGAYLVLTALAKLSNIDTFIEGVKSLGVLQGHPVILYSVLVPYLEFAAGVLLLLGLWTTLASFLAALLLCSYIYVFRVFPFGGNIFNKDIILLAATICLMYTGAGAFSIDKARQSS